MYTVKVEADFAAAHFLSRYHGKCENLHGHNYRVRLWARGETLGPGGMLADFGILK
jgi:6-pyruvoyltetrahydropterin/6-carboxytetrahydropterin synthase